VYFKVVEGKQAQLVGLPGSCRQGEHKALAGISCPVLLRFQPGAQRHGRPAAPPLGRVGEAGTLPRRQGATSGGDARAEGCWPRAQQLLSSDLPAGPGAGPGGSQPPSRLGEAVQAGARLKTQRPLCCCKAQSMMILLKT